MCEEKLTIILSAEEYTGKYNGKLKCYVCSDLEAYRSDSDKKAVFIGYFDDLSSAVRNMVRELFFEIRVWEIYYDVIRIVKQFPNLESIVLPEASEGYCTINGVLFERTYGAKSGLALAYYPSEKPDSIYTAPPETKQIISGAVNGNRYIKEFYAFHSELILEDRSIADCPELTCVRCGSVLINDNDFSGCPKLTCNLFMHSDFKRCLGSVLNDKRMNITFVDNRFSEHFKAAHSKQFGKCGDNAFWFYDGELLEIFGQGIIHGNKKEGLGKIQDDESAYFNDTCLRSFWFSDKFFVRIVVIHKGITRIAQRAFSYLRSPERIVLPDTLRSIYDEAFSNSEVGLIRIPESVEAIGDRAFWDLDGDFQTIILPSSINNLGNNSLPMNLWRNSSVYLTGEKPPENFTMWINAGLLSIKRIFYPEDWNLNSDYFSCVDEEQLRQNVKKEWHEWIEKFINGKTDWRSYPQKRLL